MGGFEDGEIEEDADIPIVEYDKNDPSMGEGVVFRSVIDCRNALATFAIVREFDYITEKSDPTRLRAHCAFEGCRWRIHASFMKNSKLFQVILVQIIQKFNSAPGCVCSLYQQNIFQSVEKI
jgi:hypothetical protein